MKFGSIRIFALCTASLLVTVGMFAQTNPSAAPVQVPQSPQNQNVNNMDPSSQDSTGSPEDTAKEMKDHAFVRKADEGSMAEVKFAELALQKSGNADVKQFAQKMIDDHTMLLQQMEPLADTVGVRTPKKLDKASQAEYKKLDSLSGADFDHEYLTVMVKDHHDDLRAFHDEATSTEDETIQAAIVKAFPVIREHTQMVDKLATANGIAVPQHKRPQPAS